MHAAHTRALSIQSRLRRSEGLDPEMWRCSPARQGRRVQGTPVACPLNKPTPTLVKCWVLGDMERVCELGPKIRVCLPSVARRGSRMGCGLPSLSLRSSRHLGLGHLRLCFSIPDPAADFVSDLGDGVGRGRVTAPINTQAQERDLPTLGRRQRARFTGYLQSPEAGWPLMATPVTPPQTMAARSWYSRTSGIKTSAVSLKVCAEVTKRSLRSV
jgi:hypothetical protein